MERRSDGSAKQKNLLKSPRFHRSLGEARSSIPPEDEAAAARNSSNAADAPAPGRADGEQLDHADRDEPEEAILVGTTDTKLIDWMP